MIQYLLGEQLAPELACQCQHPALQRLRGCGPWSARSTPEGTLVAHGTAATVAAWGPWMTGLGGLRYRLADPLPACDPVAWLRADAEGEPVELACGHRLLVRPAYLDGCLLGLDGAPGAPASSYGRAVAALHDRIAASDLGIEPSDPDAIAVARMAIASCYRLPAELIHAWGLLATSDIATLLRAAGRIPKAAAGDGPCSAASPASMSAA